MTAEVAARWSGELLWPRDDLPAGPVIDLSGVSALGSWAYPWFRARPRTAVVGAAPAIRRQMQRAQLPVLWYARSEDVAGGGVTTQERAMLWDRDDG